MWWLGSIKGWKGRSLSVSFVAPSSHCYYRIPLTQQEEEGDFSFHTKKRLLTGQQWEEGWRVRRRFGGQVTCGGEEPCPVAPCQSPSKWLTSWISWPHPHFSSGSWSSDLIGRLICSSATDLPLLLLLFPLPDAACHCPGEDTVTVLPLVLCPLCVCVCLWECVHPR